MNISLKPLSLVIGSIAGVLSILTIRHPVLCLIVAILAATTTEIILRLQDKS